MSIRRGLSRPGRAGPKGEENDFSRDMRYNGLATKDQLNAYKRLIDCISLDADQFPGDWVKKNCVQQPPFQY